MIVSEGVLPVNNSDNPLQERKNCPDRAVFHIFRPETGTEKKRGTAIEQPSISLHARSASDSRPAERMQRRKSGRASR
jgi:hypothetical protein